MILLVVLSANGNMKVVQVVFLLQGYSSNLLNDDTYRVSSIRIEDNTLLDFNVPVF